MSKPSEYFASFLYYDITSPTKLRWKIDRVGGHRHETVIFKADSPAGSEGTYGYWKCSIEGKSYKVHRIIYQLFYKDLEPTYEIDHIDGNKGNNLIENLRKVERKLNKRNKSLYKCNSSGVCGVLWRNRAGGTSSVACWYDLDGKRRSKDFSAAKYGLLPAFKMACEYREIQINKLNKSGGGYTDRHGLK